MSHIRLSREKNYGPLIPPNRAHIILGLEPLETLRILGEYGNDDTVFIVNSRPIYPLNVIAGDVDYPDLEEIRRVMTRSGKALFWLDATPIAMDLGGSIFLNMIMLGALCGLPDFPLTSIHFAETLKELFPPSRLEVNYRALEIGKGLIENDEN